MEQAARIEALMKRKTPAERDQVNTCLRIRQAPTRARRMAVVLEWAEAYGSSPEWLLEAYGRAEWQRGFMDGAAGAGD